MEKVIKQLFGDKAFNELTKIIKEPTLNKDIYIDYFILLNEIEEFKINITSELENKSIRITCSLFKNLSIIDISRFIEIYNLTCPIGWDIKKNIEYKIYFPYKIMIGLTEKIIVKNVVKHIKEILTNFPDIKSVIYAGNVYSNDFILSKIKSSLPENLYHCLSAYASEAVVKEAVIFGFDPLVIKERVSKYALGIAVSETLNEESHGKEKDIK